MPNDLYNQFNGSGVNINSQMINRIKQFKNTFSGNPQQMVQEMLDSGKVTQAQMNQYIKQANDIYKMMR